MKTGSLSESLLPSLVQCFGIIAIGYFFGRTRILTGDAARGLYIFLQFLSLPALIFTSLATLSFTNIEWKFIAAVLVTKICIFVVAALVTMVLTKPPDLGKSGLYAIATTQSNDLALGYPLMASLYKTWHSEYPSVLYVIVPVQLLILNPVGFLMLEAHKLNSNRERVHGNPCVAIAKSIFQNPIIIATVTGVLWNFAFYHTVPPVIGQLLEALASVFSTVALFALGHSMSAQFQEISKSFSLTPALIVLGKILFLPLILQRVSALFLNGSSDVNDLSSLGFLYGTIPCAPTVFIFAKQYETSVDVITSATVYSTIFSAPLMFTSATVISLAQSGFKNINYYITETAGYVGVLNFISCMWLTFTFFSRKRWRDVCFHCTYYLVLSQLATSIGAITLFLKSNSRIAFYTHYLLCSTGIYSTYIFTVLLSFLIFLLQWRSLCYVLRHRALIMSCGFVIPVLLSLLLSLSVMWSETSAHLFFQFGKAQVVVTVVVSSVTFSATVAFLIFQHRYMKIRHGCTDTESADQTSVHSSRRNSENDLLLTPGNSHSSNAADSDQQATAQCFCTKESFYSDIEDIASKPLDAFRQSYGAINTHVYDCFCDSSHNCAAEQRHECAQEVQVYQQGLQGCELDLNIGYQYVKYIILLLFLCSSMAVNVTVCISNLVTEDSGGILVELKFLDIILQNSQGIVCLFLFGYDSVICQTIFKGWQRFRQCFSTD